MKKIITVLSSLLLLSSCSILFPNNSLNSNEFAPWDKLGGYKECVVSETKNVNLDSYKEIVQDIDSSFFEEYEQTSNIINLSNLSNLPSGVSHSENLILVSKGGTYCFKGDFNGHIIVDKCNDEDVIIIFDNVNLVGIDNYAPLTFKKTTGKRVLNIKDNTRSTIKDSLKNIGIDADRSIIEVKSCPFVINGKGKLILNKIGQETSGIKANDSLYIINSQIEIDANKHGIESKKQMFLINAKINIAALGDGIRTDMDPISLEEGVELAKDITNGYLYIKNSDISITAGDDGIVSNSCLYIDNESKTIDIITNGGCPSVINESTNVSTKGKGIKVDGISFGELEDKNQITSSYKDNYLLIIDGGKFNLNCNSDSISSKGNLFINSGEFNISTGDDAINSEFLTTIRNGKVNIKNSFEGIEGAGVEIYDGEFNINSFDNGINAANSLINFDYHLSLMGGTINISSTNDGIDSNGWTLIDGASIYIDGPTNSMSSSFDNEKGCKIIKGNLIATGPRGLVENPSFNSEQYFININLSKLSNEIIRIYENSQLINEFYPTKEYQSVVISLNGMEKNKKYIVEVGNKTYEATLNDVGTALGVNASNNHEQGLVS